MPYVNIKITEGNVTKDEKAQLIAGVTDVLHNVLDKNPKSTMIVIDEVNTDNWGSAGEVVTDIRARKQAS
jgi:4-oxalocrotonate tautomerase